jgi:hypothetical protein
MKTFYSFIGTTLLATLTGCATTTSPAPSESARQTSAAALDTSQKISRDDFARDVEDENGWIDGGGGRCTLTVESSGPDVVVTLTADGDSGSLRVPADAVITLLGADDPRFKEYDVAGIGQIRVLYALDMYREMSLTPATTQKTVTCGLYWG